MQNLTWKVDFLRRKIDCLLWKSTTTVDMENIHLIQNVLTDIELLVIICERGCSRRVRGPKPKLERENRIWDPNSSLRSTLERLCRSPPCVFFLSTSLLVVLHKTSTEGSQRISPLHTKSISCKVVSQEFASDYQWTFQIYFRIDFFFFDFHVGTLCAVRSPNDVGRKISEDFINF